MSETLLLDASVLIALLVTDHVHHDPATRWFEANNSPIASCPITQGALVRFAFRTISDGGATARNLLAALVSMEGHVFWPDDVPYSSLPWRQVVGYRQVTDGYLVSLAKNHGGRLATLDQSLATVFPEALLVPTR